MGLPPPRDAGTDRLTRSAGYGTSSRSATRSPRSSPNLSPVSPRTRVSSASFGASLRCSSTTSSNSATEKGRISWGSVACMSEAIVRRPVAVLVLMHPSSTRCAIKTDSVASTRATVWGRRPSLSVPANRGDLRFGDRANGTLPKGGKDVQAHGGLVTFPRALGDCPPPMLQPLGNDFRQRRELGYVAMSRARASATVHVVADSIGQAVEDLSSDWNRERRQLWAIDTGTPDAPVGRHPLETELDKQVPADLRAVLWRARLKAERSAVASLATAGSGPDSPGRVAYLDRNIAVLDQHLEPRRRQRPAPQSQAAMGTAGVERNSGPEILMRTAGPRRSWQLSRGTAAAWLFACVMCGPDIAREQPERRIRAPRRQPIGLAPSLLCARPQPGSDRRS